LFPIREIKQCKSIRLSASYGTRIDESNSGENHEDKEFYICRVNILIRSLVCRKSFGVDWGRKKGRKENHSEGKSPSLYILLPLLLTNPKPSITFRDLLLISYIFAKILLIIKMTNILRNPFLV